MIRSDLGVGAKKGIKRDQGILRQEKFNKKTKNHSRTRTRLIECV